MARNGIMSGHNIHIATYEGFVSAKLYWRHHEVACFRTLHRCKFNEACSVMNPSGQL